MNAQFFSPNVTLEPSLHSETITTPSPSAFATLSGSATPELLLTTGRSASLLFIDQSVEAYQTLVEAVAPGTDVYLLDAAQDAIAQISQVLAGRNHITSLQIVSHGNAAQLQLGNSALNWNTLPTYAAQLQAWTAALTADADILLYGCNVAQGEMGQAFVQILSQLTQADVAASTDITGTIGNWTLEFQHGTIETSLPFDATALESYQSNLLISDFDKNGTRDLVRFNYQTGALELRLLNSAAAYNTTEVNTINLGTLDRSWQLADMADFDNNGYADLVWHNQATGDNALWMMTGTGPTGAVMLPSVGPGSSWDIVGVKDFDLNGTPDLLWRSKFDGGVAIWTMSGGVVTSCQMLPSVGNPWVITGVADANNDGFSDILWRNPTSGENVFWLMNQTNLASAIALPNQTSAWVMHELADWNGDNSVDVLWRNFSTGEVSIWCLNNGNFASNTTVATPANPINWAILDVCDLDNNGTPDMIVRNYSTGQNAFWMMDGTTFVGAVMNNIATGLLDVVTV